MRTRSLLALAALASLGLLDCSAGTTPQATTVSAETVAAPKAATSAPVRPRKILVVIEENHSLAQMRAGMPYLAGLSRKYGYATHWRALTHPSLPNYLGIVGGSTFGVTGDGDPAVNARRVGRAPSVFSQARAVGRTAGTYAESMPTSCALTSHGAYAVRHNPWTYFATDRTACRRRDVNTSTFAAAARNNRLPAVGFLIPNLVNDAHDGSLATADRWLRTKLAPVLASSDFTSGRLVVVVTADEDDRHAGNVVLTTVLHPRLHHKVVTAPMTHYSLTRYIAQVLGVRPLGAGRTAPDMRAAFGL